MNGVFLKEGEQVDQVDPETGAAQLDLLEDERDVRRRRGRAQDHRARLQPQDPRGDQDATPTSTSSEYGRFPKTLIFAANDLPHTSHADQLVDLAATSSAAATPSSRRSPAASTGRCSASASSATGRTPASS